MSAWPRFTQGAMNIPADSTQAQRTGWGATVGVAVALQWVVILASSGLAWLGFGAVSALSLLYGGAAVAVPNALLALWLTLRRQRSGTLGVAAMLLGELLKLGLTIALLAMVRTALELQVGWLALIIGVILALKAQWLAVWFTRKV